MEYGCLVGFVAIDSILPFLRYSTISIHSSSQIRNTSKSIEIMHLQLPTGFPHVRLGMGMEGTPCRKTLQASRKQQLAFGHVSVYLVDYT